LDFMFFNGEYAQKPFSQTMHGYFDFCM